MSLFFIKKKRSGFSGVLIVRYSNAFVGVQKNWYRIDEKNLFLVDSVVVVVVVVVVGGGGGSEQGS
jgi:hypothetical protein